MSIMRVLLGKCNRAFDERHIFLMNDMVLHKKARGAAFAIHGARHSQYTRRGIRKPAAAYEVGFLGVVPGGCEVCS